MALFQKKNILQRHAFSEKQTYRAVALFQKKHIAKAHFFGKKNIPYDGTFSKKTYRIIMLFHSNISRNISCDLNTRSQDLEIQT
jgi:hypothetical protein